MRVIFKDLFHKNGYGMWILANRDGKKFVAEQVTLKLTEVEETFILPEPTLEINAEHAQEFLRSMVNGLIELGVRPDNDRTAGELEATKKHLKDLQMYINQLLNKICN